MWSVKLLGTSFCHFQRLFQIPLVKLLNNFYLFFFLCIQLFELIGFFATNGWSRDSLQCRRILSSE